MNSVMGIPTGFNKRVQVLGVLGVLIGSILLSGCGQKGPLRLPPPPPEPNQQTSNNSDKTITLAVTDPQNSDK